MVIAIISILAAILFPVFAQVREKARQTACASNERQMGIAILAYAQDYDETLPLYAEVTNWNPYTINQGYSGIGTRWWKEINA